MLLTQTGYPLPFLGSPTQHHLTPQGPPSPGGKAEDTFVHFQKKPFRVPPPSPSAKKEKYGFGILKTFYFITIQW